MDIEQNQLINQHNACERGLKNLYQTYKKISETNLATLKTQEVANSCAKKINLIHDSGLGAAAPSQKKQALLMELAFLVTENKTTDDAINSLSIFMGTLLEFKRDNKPIPNFCKKTYDELENNAMSQIRLLKVEYKPDIMACVGSILAYAESLAAETPTLGNQRFLTSCNDLINQMIPSHDQELQPSAAQRQLSL